MISKNSISITDSVTEQKKKESSNFEAYWRSKITPILAALNMEIENVDILNQVTFIIVI